MFRLHRVVVLSVLILVIGLVFQSEARISVGPLSQDIVLAPGQTHTGTFQVKNTGDDIQEISVEMVDYARNLDGENTFMPAGQHPRSLTSFTTFSPATFILEPGEAQDVEYQISMPGDEVGPHWMMFLVRESADSSITTPEGEGPAVNVEVKVSFGVRIRQSDPNFMVSDGVVNALDIRTNGPDEPIFADLTFKNTGSTFLNPTGRIEIRDQTGATVFSHEIEQFRVLPGDSRQISAMLDVTLPPGFYVALGIIDFGGNFMVAGQTPFSI